MHSGRSGGDLPKLLQSLAAYDYAVATQAAHLHHTSGRSLLEPAARSALQHATALTQQAFQDYLAAWRETVIARGE